MFVCCPMDVFRSSSLIGLLRLPSQHEEPVFRQEVQLRSQMRFLLGRSLGQMSMSRGDDLWTVSKMLPCHVVYCLESLSKLFFFDLLLVLMCDLFFTLKNSCISFQKHKKLTSFYKYFMITCPKIFYFTFTMHKK